MPILPTAAPLSSLIYEIVASARAEDGEPEALNQLLTDISQLPDMKLSEQVTVNPETLAYGLGLYEARVSAIR